jgi:hypothetical protein
MPEDPPHNSPDPQHGIDAARNNNPESGLQNRRALLRAAAWGGGLAGLGGLAGFAVKRFSQKPSNNPIPRPPLGAEFTYDVSRFQSSDPSLLRYEEVSRFSVGLERARNLAVAPDGSIVVVGTGGIRKFSPDGVPTRTLLLDTPVYSVALRPSGEMLIGQPGKILVLDSEGVVVAEWGDFSAGFLPTSIALVREWIFIADAGNRVLLKLDAKGKKHAVIGERGPDNNLRGFVVPSPYFCVRMAPDGLLRVTNPGEHQIEAYTLDGEFETAWGKGSFAVDGFCGCCNPVSFDIFPDGSFVTCEKGLPRVKLYHSQGEFAGLVAGPESFPEYLQAANAGTPNSLGSGIYAAIHPNGRVLVLDVVGGTVRIMQRKAPPP